MNNHLEYIVKRCAETLEAAPEWDGHTSDDVLARLKAL